MLKTTYCTWLQKTKKKIKVLLIYEGCSEIIETLAENKLLEKLQILFVVVM